MKRVVLLAAVLSLFIFTSSHSRAGIFYVSSTGISSSACGSITTPCRFVGDVLYSIGPGTHIIRVSTGTYFETPSVPSIVDNLTIQGGWDETFSNHSCDPTYTNFLAGQGADAIQVYVELGDDIEIDFECLRFSRFFTTGGGGAQVIAGDAGSTINFTMRNCIVASHTDHGIYFFSGAGSAINVTLEDNLISNIRSSTVAGGGIRAFSYNGGSIELNIKRNRIVNNIGNGGLSFSSSGNGSSLQATLINNIIAGNQTEASSGGGIRISSANLGFGNDITLTNNTIVNNTATGSGGGLFLQAGSIYSTVIMRNNIVWGNSASDNGDDIAVYENYVPVPGNLSGLNIDYSIVGDIYVDNTAFPYINGGHNLADDPALTTDYLLKSGSPAINSGRCGYNFSAYYRIAPYDDIESDRRPGFGQLLGCDIGADEYNSLLCFPVKNQQSGTTMICF